MPHCDILSHLPPNDSNLRQHHPGESKEPILRSCVQRIFVCSRYYELKREHSEIINNSMFIAASSTVQINIFPFSIWIIRTIWFLRVGKKTWMHPPIFLCLFDPAHPAVTLQGIGSYMQGQILRMSIRIRVQVRIKDVVLQGGQVCVN